MSHNTGYWVSFDSNLEAATQVSAELAGDWLITRKSSDRWDNTTASLSISTQSSHNLTGHPFALLAMGLEDPMPISDFSLIGIQVIEDAILQLDYTTTVLQRAIKFRCVVSHALLDRLAGDK